MNEALRIRKVFGGGMRQAGYLAAAGSYALKHHRSDLNEDHRRAKEIAAELQNSSFVKEVQPVETNIIIFSLKDDFDEIEFVARLKANQILIMGLGKGKLRMVTHRDYTQKQHQYMLTTLTKMKVYA